MKHTFIITIILFGSALAMPMRAQSDYNSPFVMQSTMYQQSGSAYSSTVYEPFGTATPSEQQASEGDSDYANNVGGITQRHNAFGPRPDTKPAGTSPIGEPWVLLAFAALAAGFIAYRRKKEPTLTLPKGKE